MRMSYHLTMTIIDKNTTYTIGSTTDASLLQAIRQIPEIHLDAPCGGNGSCGKCRVRIIQGAVSPILAEEERLLSKQEIAKGIRLACRTYPVKSDDDGIIIQTAQDDGESQVMTTYIHNIPFETLRFHVDEVTIAPSSVSDQRSMVERVVCEVSVDQSFLTPTSLRKLQANGQSTQIRCLMDRGKAVRVLDSMERVFGCAIDIGTTTVVVYLVDLQSGVVIDHRSGLNTQKRFGADVISRIQAVTAEPDGGRTLQAAIVNQLDSMIDQLLCSHGIPQEDLIDIVAVGNTTMLHLLLGVDPSTIAVAPFIPVFTQALTYPVSSLGFITCKSPMITLPGSIASYVGADITSGVYACGIIRQSEPVLFLDIGTNGEIALWDGKQLHCCSSAAGPAFEGASILHGMGGISGAISSMHTETDSQGKIVLHFQTIGENKPIGICGSGIIDAIAILLNLGLVDDTGSMIDADEDLLGLIIDTPHGNAFSIVSNDDMQIYLSHKDVREVQLAKAAIAAGIRTLLTESNLAIENLSSVIIAGGFGNYIDIANAQRIGLLPAVDRSIISSAGNAAGNGAILSLLDPTSMESMQKIIRTA